MLKKNLNKSSLFSPKKAEVQPVKRTLLLLDGQQNPHTTVEELTAEILSVPLKGALWLDMPLFGSHEQLLTVAHAFKLSPVVQNLLEDKKQQPHLFFEGNNRILIFRHLNINSSNNISADNICFAVSANRLLSLQHGRIDKLENARILVTTLKEPKNTVTHALNLIIGKIVDDNNDIIDTLEKRVELVAFSFSEHSEAPNSQELLELRKNLIVAKSAVLPIKTLIEQALLQNPPLLKGCQKAPELLKSKLNCALASLSATEDLLSSLELLAINATAKRSSDILSTLATSVSILLPLMFITSLFAMNFKYMPELKSQWGYPLCLFFLAIIAIFITKKIQQKKWY